MNIIRILLLSTVSLAVSAQPLAENLDGHDSIYARWLVQVLKRWPSKSLYTESAPVNLTCIATANDEKYVGMLQRTTIHAGISAVQNVLDDVAHYKDLFPGTVDVHIVPGSQQGDRYVTAWEQRVPVFFLPNVTYELAYVVDKTAPARSVYRYKLHRGSNLTASDGMVVLEAIGPETTQFTEYDFFNAHWGPLPAAVVWRESLRSAFLSDVAIKLKAENQGWSYVRISSEAERLIASESEQIERCYTERRNLNFRDDFNSVAGVLKFE
jgi:hypothetical protein